MQENGGAKDPSQAERGLRYNQGKPRFDLLPTDAIKAVVAVLTYGAHLMARGAKKYGERNWEKGMPWNEVVASHDRHWAAFLMGEDIDQESGQSHLAHVATNALFMLTYYLRSIGADNLPLRKKPEPTKKMPFGFEPWRGLIGPRAPNEDDLDRKLNKAIQDAQKAPP